MPLRLSARMLLLACGLAFVPAAAPPGDSRQRRIAELKRQIAELQAKLAALEAPAPLPKEAGPALPQAWTAALSWRCIGPAAMGGRIGSLAVYPADPTTYWVGSASGGLLKTTNGGITFTHQFDRESSVSVGDVAVAPSDPKVVWVGTGENNPRNSVSYGDGVYKSTDGGKTWAHMGLRNTFQIGKILIHPKYPGVVYVGALGRLYGPNAERGLFKTTDGGKSWKRILYVDADTGVIDMRMHPADPEALLVATWTRRRDGFDSHAGALAGPRPPGSPVDPPLPDGYDAYDPAVKWGKGSGVWKTTNGGKSFRRITRGLPGCAMGRIGLDFSLKNPNVVYAVVDSEKIGMGPVGTFLGVTVTSAPGGVRVAEVVPDSPADRAGMKVGDVIQDVGGKRVHTAEPFGSTVRALPPGKPVNLGVLRDGKPVVLTATPVARPGRRPPPGIVPAQRNSSTLRVANVAPGSAPARAGLKVDDVITAVDGKPVTSWRQLFERIAAVEPGKTYTLTVRRGKQTLTLTVTAPRPARLTRPYAAYFGGQRENVQDVQGPAGRDYGGVYRSDDAGDCWRRVNSLNPRPMYFSQVRVDPTDDRRVYLLGLRLHQSSDGGKTFHAGGDASIHPDLHALWIDARDGRHLLVGTDGGTYVSRDRAAHWDYLNTAALGQFYHVALDSRRPYRAYGGMQDNGSWGGPSRALDGRGPVNTDWYMVQGGDGFTCAVDRDDPDTVYAESQEGNVVRHDLKTGAAEGIRPRAPAGEEPYRFNWNTPFLLSAHNARVFYVAGNRVFRSVSRGSSPRPISPELPRSGKGSASALGESPRNPDVLWAGTDDGNLWVTRDGGASWRNVAACVGLPRPFWVATVEPSRGAEGRCYVSFDAHRSDDDAPYVFVTENYGETWRSLRGNLPPGSSRCLREDRFNPDLLYLGTEFSVFASIDRGATWTRINNNLPTVAVHELAQHPTAGEMVAATHGRSLWVLDVTPLRQVRPATVKAAATLLAPNAVTRWGRRPPRGAAYGRGDRDYFGDNPPAGAQVYYALGKKAGRVSLTVEDIMGNTVATLPVKNDPGLHRTEWNLVGQGLLAWGWPGRLFGGPRQNRPAPTGKYRIVLTVDGSVQRQVLTLEGDPTLPPGTEPAGPPPARKKRSRGLED